MNIILNGLSYRIQGRENNKDIDIMIKNKENKSVFEIKWDGTVSYTVNGEYKIANTDKKLGIALGGAFTTLAELINEQKQVITSDNVVKE